jgi:hypothetical protein
MDEEEGEREGRGNTQRNQDLINAINTLSQEMNQTLENAIQTQTRAIIAAIQEIQQKKDGNDKGNEAEQ